MVRRGGGMRCRVEGRLSSGAHLAKSAAEGGGEVVGGGDGCGDGARDVGRRGAAVDGRRVAVHTTPYLLR